MQKAELFKNSTPVLSVQSLSLSISSVMMAGSCVDIEWEAGQETRVEHCGDTEVMICKDILWRVTKLEHFNVVITER